MFLFSIPRDSTYVPQMRDYAETGTHMANRSIYLSFLQNSNRSGFEGAKPSTSNLEGSAFTMRFSKIVGTGKEFCKYLNFYILATGVSPWGNITT